MAALKIKTSSLHHLSSPKKLHTCIELLLMCVVRWIGPRRACTRVSGFWNSLVYKCICNLCFKSVTDKLATNYLQHITKPKFRVTKGSAEAWSDVEERTAQSLAASRQLCPATKRAPAINSYALGRWCWSKISCCMCGCVWIVLYFQRNDDPMTCRVFRLQDEEDRYYTANKETAAAISAPWACQALQASGALSDQKRHIIKQTRQTKEKQTTGHHH